MNRKAEEHVLLEEKLQAMMEQSLFGVYLLDLEGNFLDANEAALRMLGRDREEILSFNFTSLFDEDQSAKAMEIFEEVKNKGFQKKFAKLKLTKKNGRFVWVEAEARLLHRRGKACAIQGIARDITRREKVEKAFHDRRRLFKTLVDAAPDAIVMVDTDGIIRSCNPAIKRLTGYEPEELQGKYFHELETIFPEALPYVTGFFQDLMSGTDIEDYELDVRHKDGTRHWVCVKNRILKSGGKIEGILVLARDLTYRKKVEDALRENEQRYRTLAESAEDFIFIIDRDRRVQYVNSLAASRIGCRPEDVIGKKLENLYTHIYVEQKRNLQKVFESGTPFSVEHKVKFPDQEFWLDTRLVPIRDNGNEVSSVMGISRDITRRKGLEEKALQSHKLEAIGKLAGGVSHDFNNLLTAILAYADLLLLGLSQFDPLRNDVNEIKKAGELASSLTNQLMAFSRKQLLQPKVLSLNTIVGNMENMLRRLISEDIEFDTNLDPEIGYVKADPGQMEQVLMNLVVNARDAMVHGGRLALETVNEMLDEAFARDQDDLHPGRYVVLAISDTGVGMDEETQKQIFEPFFTTKEGEAGTGLGLSTVFGIVKQSGGHIMVSSELGQGTTVKIYFPRIEGDPDPVETEQKLPEAVGGSETILMVEDNEAVRKAARFILQRNGYSVLETCDAEEALQALGQHSGLIHLMITDVVMPGMSGPELVNHIGPFQPGMKVLYVSGYTERNIPDRRVLEGGEAFLRKPFSLEALLGKVRQVLSAS